MPAGCATLNALARLGLLHGLWLAVLTLAEAFPAYRRLGRFDDRLRRAIIALTESPPVGFWLLELLLFEIWRWTS